MLEFNSICGKIETAQIDACNIASSLTKINIRGVNMANQSLPNKKSTHKLCLIPNCQNPISSRGYCGTHLYRIKTYGSPYVTVKNFGEGGSVEERFWSKISNKEKPDDCWEWQGTTSKGGYGKTKHKNKDTTTHKLAWFLTFGVRSKYLLHSCDNRKCCNPAHLREGTPQENMQDKVDRNRSAKGEGHGMAKLNENQVMEVKELLKSGASQQSIADRFGVSQVLISTIKLGKTWKHL